MTWSSLSLRFGLFRARVALAGPGLGLGALDAGELIRKRLQPRVDLHRARPHVTGSLGEPCDDRNLLGQRLVALLELRHVSEE